MMFPQLMERLNEENQAKEINQVTHTSESLRRFNSICYDDDDDDEERTIPLSDIIFQLPLSIVITTSPPILPIEDPEDSLIMGNKELSTILEKESDEFIKFSVEDLVTIPSEFEDTPGNNSGNAIDFEYSRAHGFVHHPLELQSSAYGNPIS
nr:hypothetical protein [Tanacetum cinerariifolium]